MAEKNIAQSLERDTGQRLRHYIGDVAAGRYVIQVSLLPFDYLVDNRFLKPLLEPIESEQYAKLNKDARKRYKPVSLNE